MTINSVTSPTVKKKGTSGVQLIMTLTAVNPSLPHSTVPSLLPTPTHEYHSPNHSEPEIDPVHPLSTLPPVSTHTASQLHSSNHSEANPPTNEWTSTLSPIDIAPFVQSVGPTVSVPTSEMEVFSLFSQKKSSPLLWAKLLCTHSRSL